MKKIAVPPTSSRLRFLAALLVLSAWAAPGRAQTFDPDLPPNAALAIALSNAEVRIALRPGARPRLEARVVTVDETTGEAIAVDGPTLELRRQGRTLKVERTPAAGNLRLLLEAVLEPGRDVEVGGADLEVTVTGPGAQGRRDETPVATRVLLRLESSRAEVVGLDGATLVGRSSWFVCRQNATELTLRLEEGGAQLEEQRGRLVLRGRESEISLRDGQGLLDVQLEGGSLEVAGAAGTLVGKVRRGAVLRLLDWGGEADLEAAGKAVLDLRNFRLDPQTLKVKAKGSEVTIEALHSAVVDLAQEGGELRLRDVEEIEGKVTTSLGAKVGIARVSGAWTGVFQDSAVAIEAVERLDAELYNAELELAGAADLSLIAHGSQVRATEVERISSVNLVTTTAELELTEGSRAEVMVQGLSQALLRLPRPCFVLVDGEESALDVAGCTVGAADPNTDPDASVLTGVVGGGSKLTVRAAF